MTGDFSRASSSFTIPFVELTPGADDLTGARYADLEVIGPIAVKPVRWLCRCACGNFTTALGQNLKRRGVRSCGCLGSKSGRYSRTHGLTHSPEWRAWVAMKNRCNSPSGKDYHKYGGRGIKVHPAWNASFADFLAHIGPRPSAKHSLDRINVNGNYEPGNVRWGTTLQQGNNKRSNVYVKFRGDRMTVTELGRKFGMKPATITGRLERGWSVDAAVSTKPARIDNFETWNARTKNMVLFTAVKEYLKARKASGLGAATITEIHTALARDGYKFGARDTRIARSVLRSWIKKNSPTFIKLQDGTYDLVE